MWLVEVKMGIWNASVCDEKFKEITLHLKDISWIKMWSDLSMPGSSLSGWNMPKGTITFLFLGAEGAYLHR